MPKRASTKKVVLVHSEESDLVKFRVVPNYVVINCNECNYYMQMDELNDSALDYEHELVGHFSHSGHTEYTITGGDTIFLDCEGL